MSHEMDMEACCRRHGYRSLNLLLRPFHLPLASPMPLVTLQTMGALQMPGTYSQRLRRRCAAIKGLHGRCCT